MSNISQFCALEWFEWVMFQDEMAPYPNNHFRLGRYLGPSIDIGPALMAKIMKENVQVLQRSIYLALSQEEWEWEECKAKHISFMASLHQKLGPCTELRDLVDLGVEDTPQHDPYEDELENAETFPCWAKNGR